MTIRSNDPRRLAFALTRRGLLGAAGFCALAAGGRWAAASLPDLRAAPAMQQIGPAELPQTAIWGYDGGTPGPVLRVPMGGRITRRFRNGLPQPSTVHWHGVRIDNAMDGVANLTQQAVEPGSDFLYDFTVPDDGTYWYHPHNRTWEQMARGLYGALIVEEADPPRVDHDVPLMFDDWRLNPDDARISDDFGAMHDWAHAGRIGNWITANGRPGWNMNVRTNDRLRLRLINSANARIFRLGARNLSAWIVALDGQPLSAPRRVETIELAPAQRADIIADVTAPKGEDALIYSTERTGSFAVAVFTPMGERRDAPLPAPGPLPANPVPPLGDLAAARRVELRMEGGAMGGMRGAMMGGRRMGMRELVQSGKVWAFNGRTDMPDEPLISARAGETVRIAMINDTGWPHAMHLHGHHFRVLRQGAKPGPLRDTVLVPADQMREIAFVADNPGDWLLHCHMLEHVPSGMMTWLRVTR